MQPESIIQFSIYLHAAFGGFALLAGTIALFTKKGSQPHKTAGKVFYYTMLVSVTISLIIAIMPNHINPFLFSIGVFSIYLLITGRRSLYRPNINTRIDKGIAGLIILTGVSMILSGLMLYKQTNIVLLAFGIGGTLLGLQDIYTLNDPKRTLDNRLTGHIVKITGGYIASITAFFVVNDTLPGTWNWFAPTIVGIPIVSYWTRKIKTAQKLKNT